MCSSLSCCVVNEIPHWSHLNPELVSSDINI
jgi:hypothetical protein